MENNFKFNASEVKCNGVYAGSMGILNEEDRSILRTFLKTHFMMSPPEVILNELNDSGLIEDRWIVGSRVNNIDAIMSRMLSGLLEYAIDKFDGNSTLAEMWINAQVKMMTAKEIITIMESALIDCATADHWYTYEKQY